MASINTGQFGKVLWPGLKEEFEKYYGSAGAEEYAKWSRATVANPMAPPAPPTRYVSTTRTSIPATPYTPIPYEEGFVGSVSSFNHYGIEFTLVKHDSNVIVKARFCGTNHMTLVKGNTVDAVTAACKEIVETIQKVYPEHIAMVEAIQERERREKDDDCPF